MILDNGDRWEPEAFQLEIVEPVLAGMPETVVEAPEGNAKTTLVAGLVLYMGHYQQLWNILVAAAAREQAMQLFLQAKGFADRDSRLEAIYVFQEGNRRIKCRHSGSRIQIKAADEKTGQGPIPNLAVLDELSFQRDMALYRTWHGKLGKRDGQLVGLSNAGEPGHEYELFKDAVFDSADVEVRGPGYRIARRAGLVFFRHGLQSGDDLSDVDLVKRANPLAQITVEKLEAKRDSASMTPSQWARMTCGVTSRVAAHAVPPDLWAGAPDAELPKGESCWLGADLAWSWDTTALVPLWCPEPTRRVIGRPTILVPPQREGEWLDPDVVRDAFRAIHRRNPIEVLVIDLAAEGRVIASWAEQELGCRVVAYGSTNEPQALARERWMEALREGWLHHPRDPVLTRHVMNAVARSCLGERYRFDRPSKTRQGGNQDLRVIDALVAGSNVHAAWVAEHEAPAESAMRPMVEVWA